MNRYEPKSEAALPTRLPGTALLLTLALWCLGTVFAQDMTRVRGGHLAAGAPALEVWVNGVHTHELGAFKTVTDWTELPAGTSLVELKRPGDPDTVLASVEASLRAGFRYLVAVLGTAEEPQVAVYTDYGQRASPDFGGFRVINAIADSDTLRIRSAEDCVVDTHYVLGPFRYMGPNVRYDNFEYGWSGPGTVCDGTTALLSLPKLDVAADDGYAIRGKAMTLYLVGSVAAGTVEAFKTIDAE